MTEQLTLLKEPRSFPLLESISCAKTLSLTPLLQNTHLMKMHTIHPLVVSMTKRLLALASFRPLPSRLQTSRSTSMVTLSSNQKAMHSSSVSLPSLNWPVPLSSRMRDLLSLLATAIHLSQHPMWRSPARARLDALLIMVSHLSNPTCWR